MLNCRHVPVAGAVMLKRFRLLAAVNVLLWLATLALPQAGYLSLAQAAGPDDVLTAGCLLTPGDADFDAKRSGKRKLAPLAGPAADRGSHHVLGLTPHFAGLGGEAAHLLEPAARSQIIAARFSLVFQACAPPRQRLDL